MGLWVLTRAVTPPAERGVSPAATALTKNPQGRVQLCGETGKERPRPVLCPEVAGELRHSPPGCNTWAWNAGQAGQRSRAGDPPTRQRIYLFANITSPSAAQTVPLVHTWQCQGAQHRPWRGDPHQTSVLWGVQLSTALAESERIPWAPVKLLFLLALSACLFMWLCLFVMLQQYAFEDSIFS